MNIDDPLILEEAQHRSRELLGRMAADGKRTDALEQPALALFLVIGRYWARENSICGPAERLAIVECALARIANHYNPDD